MLRKLGLLVVLFGVLGVGLIGFAQSAIDGSVPYPSSQEGLEVQPEAWPFYYCRTEVVWVEQLTGWEIIETIDYMCTTYFNHACWILYEWASECFKYRRRSLWRVDLYERCYVMGILVQETYLGQDEYYWYMNDTSWTCPGYFPFCC